MSITQYFMFLGGIMIIYLVWELFVYVYKGICKYLNWLDNKYKLTITFKRVMKYEIWTFVILALFLILKHILEWHFGWTNITIGLSHLIVSFTVIMIFQIFLNSSYFKTFKTTFYDLQSWNLGRKEGEEFFFHFKLFILTALLYFEVYYLSIFQFYLASTTIIFLLLLALYNTFFYLVPIVEKLKNKVLYFFFLFSVLSLIILYIYYSLNNLKPFIEYTEILSIFILSILCFGFISMYFHGFYFQNKNNCVIINLNWAVILIFLGAILYFKCSFHQFYLEDFFTADSNNFYDE